MSIMDKIPYVGVTFVLKIAYLYQSIHRMHKQCLTMTNKNYFREGKIYLTRQSSILCRALALLNLMCSGLPCLRLHGCIHDNILQEGSTHSVTQCSTDQDGFHG